MSSHKGSTISAAVYSQLETSKGSSSVEGVEDQTSRERRHEPRLSGLILMISFFIVGTIFAIAHHVYYVRLNDTIVGSSTRQQWPIRFGTAFAFLVKVGLATATGTAYIQWAWSGCRQKAVTIGAVDAVLAANKKILPLLQWNFLCISLSSLITPATLSVESKSNTTLHMLSVNRPAISKFDQETNSIYSPRSGYSATLSRDFNVSALTGELLHLSAPGNLQNASFNLEIVVPIVRCFPSNAQVRAWTATSAFRAMLNGNGRSALEDVEFYPQNLALVSKKTNETQQIGYHGLYGNTSITTHASGVPADLWIAIIDAPSGTTVSDLADSMNPTQFSGSFYTCSLRNASIDVKITFVNNVQSLHVFAVNELEFDPTDPDEVRGDDDSPLFALENYYSFGQQLYGQLLGTVSVGGIPNRNFGWTWTTNIDQATFGSAANFATMMNAWKDGGIEPGYIVQPHKNLTTFIEEFSVNAFLSLMSRRSFGEKILNQVNETIWVNKYTYQPRNLLVAYGCSILASVATILLGAYAIYANGKSYDINFSTISNTVQNPEIEALFNSHPTQMSMFKKKTNRTKIRLVDNGENERFCIEK